MHFFEKKMHKYLVNSKKSSTFAPAFEKETTGAVVQLVRIPACHAVGREFESRPHRSRLREHANTSKRWSRVEAQASLLFKKQRSISSTE